MSGLLPRVAWTVLSPSFWSVALCALRFAPITYLCPLLGGFVLPSSVRVTCVLSLAVAAHLSGVQAGGALSSHAGLLGAAVSEALAGIAIGWVASLPFEGARLGGKLVDLFRGTSAEVALPGAGASDATSAEAFHRLAVALAMIGFAWPQVIALLWRSFRWIPLGQLSLTAETAARLPTLATAMMTSGLAISAPVLAVTLGVEALFALAARMAPSVPLTEAVAPTRILSGSAVIWLALGLVALRAEEAALAGVGTLEAFLKSAAG